MMSYGMHIRYLSEDQAPLEHAVVAFAGRKCRSGTDLRMPDPNIRQISYNYKDWAKKAFKIVVDIDKNELKQADHFPGYESTCRCQRFITGIVKGRCFRGK